MTKKLDQNRVAGKLDTLTYRMFAGTIDRTSFYMELQELAQQVRDRGIVGMDQS